MDSENISMEDALPQVTPDPIVGANPLNLPQESTATGPLPVPTPAGGSISPETPVPKKSFLKSKIFLILLALIILASTAAVAFYFIRIAPVNKSQPSSSAENQSQNYSQSNNLENQNAVLNPNQVIPANAAAEGKLLIRSKNGDFLARDIASGQEIMISKGDLKAGPGRGTGDSISPNGQYIYYKISDSNNKQSAFIFDFKTQKNYQVNNLDPSLWNAKWSEDSKALLTYLVTDNTIAKAQLIAVDDFNLSNLSPKDLNIPSSKSRLEITKFPNNNELWYATSDQNEQLQQIYKQAYSQGKNLTEQDFNSLTANLVIHAVLLRLNLQSQKEDKIMEINIPMNQDKLKEMNHCSGKFESIVDKLLYICAKQEQGKLKLYFLDPRDFSITNEVEMQANDVNENTIILFRNPKALNKVIIETKNTLNQGTGEEQTLYFRQMPNLAELPNEPSVKLQEISPNFDKKDVHIEEVSPYGVFMVFSIQENCQPKIACDQNHYLYDFRNRTSKLIYSDKAGDLNIDVKQVLLSGY